MKTMTDGEALLEAIRDNPDDDTPRLVYADWLQENGEDDRAEFIRVQCELAKRTTNWTEARVEIPHGVMTGRLSKDQAAILLAMADTHPDPLQARESELLSRHREQWSACPCPVCEGDGQVGLSSTCPTCGGSGDLLKKFAVLEHGNWTRTEARPHAFHRGFLHTVHATLAEWGAEVEQRVWCEKCQETWKTDKAGQLTKIAMCRTCGGSNRKLVRIWQPTPLARALVANLPLSGLRAEDREPYHNGGGYCWFDVNRDRKGDVPNTAELPTAVFWRLDKFSVQNTEGLRWRPYHTPDLARDALALALVKLTREATAKGG